MYKTIFFFFFLAIQLLAHGDDSLPLSDTDGGGSTIVHNAVSVISGDYIESNNDLIILGPEPLIYQTSYSSSGPGSWRHNQRSFMRIVIEEAEDRKFGKINAFYTEPSGRTTPFRGVDNEGRRHIELDFMTYAAKGYTNFGSGIIGACNHAKNIRVTYSKNSESIVAKNGFGSESYFKSKTGDTILDLRSEVKANGNQFQYIYDKYKNLEEVKVLNKKGKTLSWLKFVVTPKKDFEVHASDGRKIIYKFENTKNKKYHISKVIKPDAPHMAYEYGLKDGKEKEDSHITKKIMPGSRFLSVDYYKLNGVLKKDDFRLNRVKSLKAPAGNDAKPVEIYRFEYTAKTDKTTVLSGNTKVFDGNNHVTHYGYTKDHRIECIQKFRGNKDSDYTPYSFEKYFWDKWGNLTCRSICNGHEKNLIARTFDYDYSGNIIKDSYYGNLTGNSPAIHFDKKSNRPISNGCDVWTVDYQYTSSNLLSKEKESSGKTTRYFYDDKTRLLIAKYISEKGVRCIREFYDYDENALVTCRIVDDGTSADRNDLTSVTQRKITRTYNSSTIPIGLPIRVDEHYYNFIQGSEVLLKRTINSYDIKGQLLEKKIHDCRGRYLYSFLYEYDAHGNVVLFTKPSGDTIEKKYNENDELIFERGVSKDSYKELHYDFMGRLIQLQEFHDDGTVLTTAHSYDIMGNLIATIDPFGHKTVFTYDEFNRLIKTEAPGFYGKDGELISPSTSQAYDIFGNVTKCTDALGRTTEKTYNVRGDPLTINYPDKTEESFTYNLDGTIKKSVLRNGSYSLYQYDCFKRLLKKEHYSAEGALFYVTSSTYNSFYKLSETDASGAVTKFTYDCSGQLTSISKNDTLKEFEYDDCFRLVKTKEWTSEKEFHATIVVYDLLDRVIEERVENSVGKLLRRVRYMYDKKDNKIQIMEEGLSGPSITRNYFDSHNHLIKTIDREGNETNYRYHYHAFNKLGQMILETVAIDPLGTQTFTEISVFDKPERIFKKNSMGELISEKEIFYDAAGNVNCIIEKAITNKFSRSVKTEWQYNKANLLTSLIEASGSSDQKTTQCHYNALGEKIITVKPDGTEIYHTYDALGRLQSFSASDNSFSYVYEYDKSDNLINVYDKLHDQNTTRVYDECNRLKVETLGTALKVEYRYDRTGRPTLLTLPDKTSVRYTYDGIYLKNVERLSKENKVLYTHNYASYDLSGHSVLENQILNGSEVKYTYDLSGRLIGINSDKFSEKVSYDARGNLITAEIDDPLKSTKSEFGYDDLNQLSSENGVANHTYTHDSLYNCVIKDGVSQEVNSLNQLLKSIDQNFSYDKNGNRIQANSENEETNYTYDALDRLTKVTTSSEVYLYRYDSFNRRLSKIKTAKSGEVLHETLYLYAGQNEIGRFENGELTEFRVLGAGKGAEIGGAIALELNKNIYIPIHDHNGNVVQIKDALTNAIVETYRYSAFGETEVFDENGHSITHSNVQNPWQFASKRLDDETGFINFGRRYYDAKTAKWISPDPLGFDEGPNLYAYVNNSPLCHFDLYGLKVGGCDSYATNFNRSYNSYGSNSNVYFTASPFFRMVGQFLQSIASHVIPVPGFREVIMGIGKGLAGRGFSLDSIWESQQSESLYPIGRNPIKGHTNISINGILTPKKDGEGMCQHLSDALGGQVVNHVFNATRGLMTDLSECALLILGFETESVRVARKTILQSLEQVGVNGTIDIYAHSMGGLITARAIEGLTRDQLGQLNIYTFGSAKMIKDDRLNSCVNIVSVFDPIPFIADPLGCLKGIFSKNSNIEFPSPCGYPFMDHCFMGGTYEKECQKITRNSNIKHGTI